MLPVLAFALGLALLLLPVAGRNYAVTGGFYLTTSQFGPNFYIGNNPSADGTYMSLRPGRGAPEFERQDATELAERARQRSLTPGEVSSYWTEQALAFITSQPGDWLALVGRKIALLWNRGEMLDTESQESYEEISPVLRVLGVIGHFGIVVPLALVGADRPRGPIAGGCGRSSRCSPPTPRASSSSMCSRAIAFRWCRSSCCWQPTASSPRRGCSPPPRRRGVRALASSWRSSRSP